MPSPMSVDIKDILVAAGIGVFASTSSSEYGIYIGQGAEKPDNLIAIFDLSGTTIEPISKDQAPDQIGTHRVQIKVRANSYVDAYDKIIEIEQELERKTRVTVGNIFYNVIYRLDQPTFDGYDEQNRAIWRQNWAALRQMPSSSSSSSSSSS